MAGYTTDSDPSVTYYDSDYPSEFFGKYRENFDASVASQAIGFDVPRYRQLAAARQGPVVELCCGSGRIAIPLARDGHTVVGVDASKPMLARLEANLREEEPAVAQRIKPVYADVTSLSLNERFNLIICGFNSLLMVSTLEGQLSMLRAVREHLTDDGLLVIDVVNAFCINLKGDPVPRPAFIRRNPHTGNFYSRFDMSGPVGPDQRQQVYGYYDEIEPDGHLRRQYYILQFRHVFRHELELMLRIAGLALVKIEGGYSGQPVSSIDVPRFFVHARRA